ncbi:MAG TPA: hypothetical protein VMM38_06165 [Aridibacter sp.]|nr:hypothetical protein [Aridibacter sp.]
MNHGSSGLLLLVIYLLLAVFLMPLFQGPGSERDLINRAAAASLVERTTFDISRFEKEMGERFTDVKRVGDRVYPARPPGFTIVSAPFYALARVFLGEADSGNLKAGWFVLRFLLASCPLLLLGIWLFGSEVDAFSLGVFLFATPLFPLSLIYSPLVFVAVLVYLAFRVIFDFDRVMPGRCFTAGLFLGFCLLCDIRALLPIAVFFVGLLFTGGKDVRSRLAYYLAGIVPFAAALAFYSWWLFGSVLAVVPVENLRIPVLYTYFEMWFSPSKGLFFYAPVLLFSIYAVFTTKAGGTLRFGVKYSLIVLALVLSVFWRESDTGLAVPASTFAIVLPMFLDPLFDGESDEYSSLWRGFFFTLSLLFCTIPVLVYPFAPASLDYPHNSFWQPLIFEHHSFVPNAVGWFGFESPWLIAVPVAALLLILFALLRTARYPARFAIGVLAGLLLVGNYMFFTDLELEKARPFVEQISGIRDQV